MYNNMTVNNIHNRRPNKIFVGGIPREATQGQIIGYFSQFGKVSSFQLPMHQERGFPKGFAFMSFQSEQEKLLVLSQQQHYILGKKLTVREAVKHSTARKLTRRLKSLKIFVKGLKSDAKQEEIEKFFSQFGEVDRVLFSVHSNTTRFKGYCFVVMRDRAVFERLVKLGKLKFKGKLILLEQAQSDKQYQKNIPVPINKNNNSSGRRNLDLESSIQKLDEINISSYNNQRSTMNCNIKSQNIYCSKNRSSLPTRLFDEQIIIHSTNKKLTRTTSFNPPHLQPGPIFPSFLKVQKYYKPDVNFSDRDSRTCIQKVLRVKRSDSTIKNWDRYRLNV